MRAFGAPWDAALSVVSVVATAIFLLVAALPLPGALWPVRVLVLAAPLAALPFVVRGYEVRDGALWIRRLFWQTRVDLSGLRSACADPAVLRGSIRLCGNGGLYSFTGWYWNRRLGVFHAYATGVRRVVVLTLDDRRVVVTPDDPEAFVQALLPLCRVG